MDDAKTRKMLDILGDQFLTGGPKSTGDEAKPKAGDQDPPDADAASGDQKKSTLGRDALRQVLQGPSPIRLSPKLRQSMPDPPAQILTRQPQPPATSLRLTSDEVDFADDDTPASARPTPRVEAVFLGNLPGFGGPWLTQYAHYLSMHVQPDIPGVVVVLRVDDEAIDIELVGPHQMKLVIPELLRDAEALGLERMLWELTRSETFVTKAFVLHLPTPTPPALLEMAGGARRWTLVSGADDAAVVGAYRLLKQLVESFGRDDRHVGLMVMGADADRAREATDKLAATAGSHLNMPVELIGSRKQMVPITVKAVATFTDPLARWPIVRAFLHELTERSADAPLGRRMHAESAGAMPSDDGDDALDHQVAVPASAGMTPDDELLDDAPRMDSEDAHGPAVASDAADDAPADEQTAMLIGGAGGDERVFDDEPADSATDVDQAAQVTLGVDAADDVTTYDDSLTGGDEPATDDSLAADTLTNAVVPDQAAADDTMIDDDDRGDMDPEVGELSDILRAQYEREAPRRSRPRGRGQAAAPGAEPSPAQAAPSASASRATQAPPRDTSAPARPTATTAGAAPSDEPDLAAFLDLGPAGGGLVLQARRPGHERTQVLLDEAGTLHLLHRHDPGEGDTAESLRAAVLELIDTRQWVREHIALLQLTQRQCRFDLEAEPVLHLFTPDAKLAVSLADSIGTYVKLHLLQRVAVGREQAWVCTALN